MENDMIVFCSGCNLAVHQSCYGIDEVPEDDWYCAVCQVGASRGLSGEAAAPATPVPCAVCQQSGGAMVATQCPDAAAADGAVSFVHTVCINHVPSLYYSDPARMLGVAGLDKIPPFLRRLACEVCGVKNQGVCVQCKNSSCRLAFHMGCAREAGYDLDVVEKANGQTEHRVFCPRHRKTPMTVDVAAHLYRRERVAYDAAVQARAARYSFYPEPTHCDFCPSLPFFL